MEGLLNRMEKHLEGRHDNSYKRLSSQKLQEDLSEYIYGVKIWKCSLMSINITPERHIDVIPGGTYRLTINMMVAFNFMVT